MEGNVYRRSSNMEIQNTVDELGIEQNEDDIQISLIQTYMQVLYAMESVRINQNTVEVSTAQRDRAVELLRAGSISKVGCLSWKAS